MADGGMPKSQITLGLGIFSLIAPCIPCVGSMLYMITFIGTWIMGIMAHSEAKETGEDTTMAKVGMALSLVWLVLGVILVVLYVVMIVFAIVAGNM